MPHIVIEHHKDISSEIEINKLALTVHNELSNQETVKKEAIKTRTIEFNNLVMGDNDLIKNYIHITILLLKGRSEELKNNIAKNIFSIAKEFLGESFFVTTEVRELQNYIK